MSDQLHTTDARITKLEESVGYSDHTIDQLSSEIARVNQAVLSLSRRLIHLESRLSELNDRVGEDIPNLPPPHSAGPDIPREPL